MPKRILMTRSSRGVSVFRRASVCSFRLSAEMTRDFRFRLSDVEKALLEFERRGNAFFDERLRLGRFRELFDRERLRRDFESEAVAGLPYEVERRVDGIVDWMVEAELRQWQDVMALLAERPAARGLGGPRRRPLRLRPRAAPRERPRGGAGGGPSLRRAVGGAAAGREGAGVGRAGRAAAGLGPRPRHPRGRARQHHGRRRHRHPRRGGALAHRPLPAARAAREGPPGARGQGHRRAREAHGLPHGHLRGGARPRRRPACARPSLPTPPSSGARKSASTRRRPSFVRLGADLEGLTTRIDALRG